MKKAFLCVSVYARMCVCVFEGKKETKGGENLFNCVGCFSVCMFVFVGVDHPIKWHGRHPSPSASGSVAGAALQQ